MSEFFSQMETKHGPLTAAQICHLARLGDAFALRAVKHEAHYLGLGLANLATLFAPEIICLGGGVMRSSDLFLGDVKKLVRSLCTQVPVEYMTVALSSLRPDIGLMGAAQSWLLRNP
jgi:glucokinase